MARVAQNLSSDNLFHFMKKMKYLQEIIQNKYFLARYVYEEIPNFKYKLAIPMKCFCDIPLGSVKKHMSKYGHYGIGITKEFAMKKFICPVLYAHEKSNALLNYETFLINCGGFDNYIDTLVPYIKLYEIQRKDKNDRIIVERYYNEREWRYVPDETDIIELDNNCDIKSEVNNLNDNLKTSKVIDKYKLGFELSDINYIFLRQESEVEIFYSSIVEKLKLSNLEKGKLMSKIITSGQIERDF